MERDPQATLETADRLEEIRQEVLALLGEAEELLQGERRDIKARADAYWLSEMAVQCGGDGLCGRSMCSIDTTIDELRASVNDGQEG